MSDVVLEAKDITVRYGGTVANEGVSLSVKAGEVVGLIGPNGAGKTTLVDALTGFAPSTGEVWLRGVRVDGRPAHARRSLGMARTWQAGDLFDDLTVAKNVEVALSGVGWRTLWTDIVVRRRGRIDPRVESALDALGLAELADRLPTELSLGQRKLLGVSRALVGDQTGVLLLDEPAAGLDTIQSHEFVSVVRSFAAGGLGVLLIDHDMPLMMESCDRLYVLDRGQVIAAGTPTEVRSDVAVVDAFLGKTLHAGTEDS